MNSEERDRLAKELLEAVLARHGMVEPLRGMEDRLLARIEANQVSAGALGFLPGRRRKRGAAVAELSLALLAAGAVAFYFAHRSASVTPVSEVQGMTQIKTANTSRSEVEPAVNGNTRPKQRARLVIASTPPAQAPRASTAHPRSKQAWDGPRRDRFPTPEPLTQEEKLLLTYLKETPAPEVISFHDPEQLKQDLQPRPLEALRIEPPKPGGAE